MGDELPEAGDGVPRPGGGTVDAGAWRAEARARAGQAADDGFELWLASHSALLRHLDLAPLGVELTPLDFTREGPDDWDLRGMLRMYHRLNAVAFGPRAISMDLWVMIDLALLGSALLIVTLPLERVAAEAAWADTPPATREMLAALLDRARELQYHGPVPVAGYCASATAAEGSWMGWSLCSALPGRGLAKLAKGVGLAAYRARKLIGVTQYDNPALRIHRSFGPMRVIAAVLDLHPVPHTMVYETDLAAPNFDAEPTWMVDARDAAKHQEMQTVLESGAGQLHILKPGLTRDGQVPVLVTAA